MSWYWSRWVALLSRQETGGALALFRIGVGLCVVWSIGSVIHSGLLGVLWVDKAYGGYRSLGGGGWLIALLGGPSPQVIAPMAWLCLGGGAALAAGLGGRLTALVVLQLFLALSNVNNHAGGSDDPLLSNALWLLVLARSTATLSLDCRLRTGRWRSGALVSSWPRWLGVFQLFLMYFSTGLQKVSASWTPAGGFSALYYILQQPTWQRRDMLWVAEVYPLTQLATALTWSWELGAPLWLLAFWYRHTRDRPGRLRAWSNRVDLRLWLAAIGAALHLGILLSMEVGPFSAVALSYYSCLVHPDELARWGARYRGFRSAQSVPSAPPT